MNDAAQRLNPIPASALDPAAGLRGTFGALSSWVPLILAGYFWGSDLAIRPRSIGLPVRDWMTGAALAAAVPSCVVALAYLLWLPLSWLGPLSRRGAARTLAALLGACLLLVRPFRESMGPGTAAAVAAAAAAAGSCALLARRGWRALAFAACFAAGVCAAGFAASGLLLDRLGPWLGLAAAPAAALTGSLLLAAAGRSFRRSPERLGAAFLSVAIPLSAGAAHYGVLVPARAWRGGCLAPRALLGVDGRGGCFALNRGGGVFHLPAAPAAHASAEPRPGPSGSALDPAPDGGPSDGARRLGIPPGARLGTIRSSGGRVAALELRAGGDRLWFLEDGAVRSADVGRPDGQAVFIADFDLDGGLVVAVDAMGPRLIWSDPDGRIVKTAYPPAEEGAPHLVSAEDGRVRLYTDSGAVLTLSSGGAWSVLRAAPPEGRPVAFVRAGSGYLLSVRKGPKMRVYRLDPREGRTPSWRDAGVAGAPHRLCVDRLGRVYRLEGGVVRVVSIAGSIEGEEVLQPVSPSVRRAFERSPLGDLLRRLE